jgi:MinD-like ATPase involved in chromosome partitioning or flagellar assembly
MEQNLHLNNSYEPAGRLIPVFTANEALNENRLTLSLAKAAASRGETVLLIDAQGGDMMKQAGVIYLKTFADVLSGEACLRDAQYITSNEHFTAMALGHIDWAQALGSLSALSLDYDWVFIATPSGCTPAHINLASAADMALMLFDANDAQFMRAYWMLEAIRQRDPMFDPLFVAAGPHGDAVETASLLRDTVKSFLGAAPDYMGHMNHPSMAHWLLQAIRKSTHKSQVA